jgi:hypothetical protein
MSRSLLELCQDHCRVTAQGLGVPDKWDRQTVLTAMNGRDRHELVILTSAWNGFIEQDPAETSYTPKPIYAEQMILSPLGGWLKSRGNWQPPLEVIRRRFVPIDPFQAPGVEPEPPLENLMRLLDPDLAQQRDRAVRLPPFFFPGEPLNISEWVHVATQGRDHYVRIVYEGYLYPFGHRAALIKVTERKIRNIGGTPVAYLAQRMFIVVREPLKNYVGALPQEGRAMPLKQVRFTTLVTPDIDPPTLIAGQYTFWVKVSGDFFKFHSVGQDGAGHSVDFTTTLIFVPNSDVSAIQTVRDRYMAQEHLAARVCHVPGQLVTYAAVDQTPSDNTTLITRSLYFDADWQISPQQKLTLLPKLEKAAVNLDAVEQILGTTAPTEIKYFPSYLNGGFDRANEVFAELLNKVSSNFSADKGGGMATPDLAITCVTRKLGAIAGSAAKAAAADLFDPKDFFNEVKESAKLFGKLPLVDLITENGSYANAPKIQALPQASPPQVKLSWQPTIADDVPSVGVFKFKKEPSSKFTIEGIVEQPIDGNPGRSIFKGELTDFSLEFFNVIKLSFNSFKFHSETNRKTDVNVQLRGKEALEFLGDLKFINTLKEIIPPGLFGDGPSLEITPQPAIRAGFSIGLPPVEVGVFALKDVALGAALTLPFLDGSPLFEFNISERHRPFNLTIAFFGGGGFFRLQLDTQAVRVIEASFEFGASASVNLGVASGGVYIMAGIYFKLETKADNSKKATLAGFFRMGGNLTVLGFISVSLEFNLSFTYESVGKATGKATLTIKVKVLFISKSIEITVEKTFGGGKGDPIFAQVWDDAGIWNEYAGAFA